MRLRTPGVRIARAVFSWKQINENHPDNESPDVGPPRDSAGIRSGGRKRSCSVEELHDEPEPQHDESGNLNDLDEYKNRHERQNTGARVRDKISAQYSGNGAAGADAGNGHVVVQYRMDNACTQSAEKIKYEVPEMAQPIFDIVAEYPEVPHVPDQVKPASVQKHGREKGNRNGRQRQMAFRPGKYSRRHDAVMKEKGFEVSA
jgi:hypothetical protein